MKKKTLLSAFTIASLLTFLLSGCLEKEFESIEAQITDETTFEGFDFATITSLDITISAVSPVSTPIKGAVLELFSENPLLANGTYNPNANQYKMFKGSTTDNGSLNTVVNCTIGQDSLFILSYYVGLPTLTAVKINAKTMDVTIGGNSNQATTKSSRLKGAPPSEVNVVNGYHTLGSWDYSGVPDYLEETSDNISAELLEKVNASLPEGSPLTETHPQYLNNSNDANLNVIEDCEVWVTFVHEGAGWRNTLGYYTYPIGNPPASVDDINDLTVIFPNVSYGWWNSGLNSGDKVQLHYLDQDTQEYTNVFPANTTIAWFIVAQGFSNGTIGNGIYTHYSDIALNNEPDPDLKKHNVLLYDEEDELLLMGFEDIRRDQNSDEDFNDAVFYTTVTPFTAVNTTFYQPVDTPTDSDGDGVTDTFDEFPDDAGKAFNNHYPAENTYGTLIFEDLWPSKGDYDFNDLVIDYNFCQHTNSENQITAIDSRIVVRAIGASYHNGFGIELNMSHSRIESVSGQRITKDFLNLRTNGTEIQQDFATIIYFDDAFNNLPYPGTGIGVNTTFGTPYVEPDTQLVSIQFKSPMTFNELGAPPYNPFMIIDGQREIEVHLPNHQPTRLASTDLLGTGDDDSDSSQGKYYVSDQYLPWAINLPQSFDYPYEKEDITQAYLQMAPWATSRGYTYMDWFQPLPNYRDESRIYQAPND